MTCIITSINYAIIFILVIAKPVISDDKIPIPTDKLEINKWFTSNIQPFEQRKGTLDALLAEAEATRQTIKVRKDGSGNFKTVTEAINSIPSGNKKRVNIDIGAGVYHEKITVNRTKPFVTLYGSPGTRPTLQFDGTALEYGTLASASLAVEGDYFIAYNLIIKNSAPKPSGKKKLEMAVALRVSGDKAAFYKCDIHGFQDTLCDDRGRHLFFGCYVEGTMDFIFGGGKSLYLLSRIHGVEKNGVTVISAHAGEKLADSGYVFVHCQITGDKKDSTLLGRYWIKYPQVLYAYSTMSDAIKPIGWENTLQPERNGEILFGEYKNTGAGSSTAGRAKMSKEVDAPKAQYYLNLGYIEASKWLLPPPFPQL